MILHFGSVRGLALALAAAAGLVASAQACPQSCLQILSGPDDCTTAAQRDTSGVPALNSFCGPYQAGYSIPGGTLYSAASSGFDGCRAQTTVEDDFSVIGAPAGTVVPLTARLSLSLYANDLMGPGNAYAGLVEGTSNSSAVDWNLIDFGGNTRETVLSVQVTAIVGTPFHMRYFVGSHVGELCFAQWHGTFDFTEIPAGVSVVSCNGYAQAPTPTLPSSWGRLKARYR
jgi:hypothetical protein